MEAEDRVRLTSVDIDRIRYEELADLAEEVRA